MVFTHYHYSLKLEFINDLLMILNLLMIHLIKNLFEWLNQ